MDEQVARWNVTNQVQQFGTGPDGRATEGMQVYFETTRGNRGSVFVPMSMYTTAKVQEMVGRAAAQMDAVSLLAG